MDTLTHTLVGALAVRACYRTSPVSDKSLYIVAVIASAFPDIDYLLFFINPLTFLADWHRSITHSFIMLPIWAMALGYVMSVIFQNRNQWRIYSLYAGIGLASHILIDVITVFETKIFSPLSSYEASMGTTFVIDGYFTMIAALTLLTYSLCIKSKFQKHLPLIGLVCIGLYISLQSTLKDRATMIAGEYVNRSVSDSDVITAIPQPYSPFYWKLILTNNREFKIAYVDLLDNTHFTEFTRIAISILSYGDDKLVGMVEAYRPVNALSWQTIARINSNLDKALVNKTLVYKAWQHDQFQSFRQFAHFPTVYNTHEDGCVSFTDIRYVLPNLFPPFRYGMCVRKNNWSLFRLRRFKENDRQIIASGTF